MKKQTIIKIFAALLLSVSAVPAFAPTVSAENPGSTPPCVNTILTLPVWYRNLPGYASCKPKIDDLNQIWVIVINVVEMLLHVAGYVATIFIIWGGFRFMLSKGDPGAIVTARNTIVNASIGLLIALAAIAIVNFILGTVGIVTP